MLAEKSNFFIVIGLFCFFFSRNLNAQFAPAPPNIFTTAIHKNDTNISFWANEIQLYRGWQDIADTTLGKTTVGEDTNVLGKANNKVISLGDSGVAILKFPFPIYNVEGYDFAVFENGFAQTGSPDNEFFIELAIVEISENGIDYIPFESTSNINTDIQVASFSQINCTKINNLAGKYPANFGTPFDIDELGLDSIVSIKIIDVVGTINTLFATLDSYENIINDPYPTAFGSGGFDLDAVAALNQPNKINFETSIINTESNKVLIYPNPTKKMSFFFIETENKENIVEIFSLLGRKIYSNSFKSSVKISTNNFNTGIYIIKMNGISKKLIIE